MRIHVLTYSYVTRNGSLIHQKETFLTGFAAKVAAFITRHHPHRTAPVLRTVEE